MHAGAVAEAAAESTQDWHVAERRTHSPPFPCWGSASNPPSSSNCPCTTPQSRFCMHLQLFSLEHEMATAEGWGPVTATVVSLGRAFIFWRAFSYIGTYGLLHAQFAGSAGAPESPHMVQVRLCRRAGTCTGQDGAAIRRHRPQQARQFDDLLELCYKCGWFRERLCTMQAACSVPFWSGASAAPTAPAPAPSTPPSPLRGPAW
jgi:hypothetical protein